MGDDRLEIMKKYYDSITLPPELKVTVERGIKQAKADSIRQEQQTKRQFVLSGPEGMLSRLFR